jgi:hypothetical protein
MDVVCMLYVCCMDVVWMLYVDGFKTHTKTMLRRAHRYEIITTNISKHLSLNPIVSDSDTIGFQTQMFRVRFPAYFARLCVSFG